MSTLRATTAAKASQHARIALVWALFVAYGSLVPLEFRPRADAWQAFMATPWLSLGVGSRADWVANVLLYLVLAWFASGAVWTSRLSVWVRTPLLACSPSSPRPKTSPLEMAPPPSWSLPAPAR